MGKLVPDVNTLQVKAGIYTVEITLTEELQSILLMAECSTLSGVELLLKLPKTKSVLSNLPEDTITILIDHSPGVMCSIIRRKSKWSRRRIRHVPLSAFLPYLPCHRTKDSERAIDKVFFEYGDDEEIVRQMGQGPRKSLNWLDRWQVRLQVESREPTHPESWSIRLWIYDTADPRVFLPVSDQALSHSWKDEEFGLTRLMLKEIVRRHLETAVDACPILHRFEQYSSLSARTGTETWYTDPDSQELVRYKKELGYN